MPFFSPGTPCDWDRLYMVCYIGLNKHLGEPQNKKKYDPVMQLMDYISTPEGQLALAADTGAMYSSVKKVPAPDIPEIADMLPALSHGRYAIFPEPKNAQDALRESLAGMLAGALTQDDVIRMVDHQNKNPPPPKACTVIGEATTDFTLIETGNFLTDAMRAKAGTDVALFLDNGKDGKYNGKGASARFRPQTTNDVSGPSPGENLLRTLEYAIPADNDIRGWFYYFPGLKMTYAPSAMPGKRIIKITDAEGKPLEAHQRVYTAAVMDQTFPEDAIQSLTDTGISIQALLTETIQSRKTITPGKDGRFIIR